MVLKPHILGTTSRVGLGLVLFEDRDLTVVEGLKSLECVHQNLILSASKMSEVFLCFTILLR